ncbi:MFS transporter [Actinomadura madurae]|uniref:MFS transporter n=1 Tax=Actinomadura madurae TaxID=1993 RepID=UPI0020265373|nr:MFS transporter [Actinomadura madurae]MCP9955614.1 MHS family MFS transporter [Actinomadura madurae]MCQ0003592.1 MHS family MFS transporter [Actinomadura madurae]URN01065.1 MHS family MFS transporter [Actinomadura madurae]URN03206.1 MHS family MFS transporter [Actinomadura madurae]
MTEFTSTPAAAAPPGAPATSSASRLRRLVTVAVLAQAVEYFDFFVYATASAIFLGPLFFSGLGDTASTLASFSTFAVGFVARPVGGAVAGHFGDRYGRKPMLVASTVVMGGATFLMGLLPTAATIGWAAAVALTLLRLLQGFALGGQWGGASLLLTESAPAGRRGFFGSFVQVGSQLGLMGGISAFLVLAFLFSDEQMMAWGWRIPFLSGLVMIGIGLYIHRAVEDTPKFKELQATRPETAAAEQPPLVKVLREHWRTILFAGGAFVLPNAVAFIVVAGILDYGVRTLHLAKGPLLGVILAGCVAPLFFLPYFAHLSDRVGRPKLFILGAVGVVLWGWPMFAMIDTGDLWLVFAALFVCFTVHSMMFGPQVALYSELFSTDVRFSGASLGYQVGSVFGGGIAPLVTTALLDWTKVSWSVAAYMTVLGGISLVSIVVLRRQANSASRKEL